mmetsp:Transcript_15099/g.33294  ORF Transcript_15099/g.33294 Transcript_15099/m.33294 type:complete len:195 (+) Transcript_15099:68-652(+)
MAGETVLAVASSAFAVGLFVVIAYHCLKHNWSDSSFVEPVVPQGSAAKPTPIAQPTYVRAESRRDSPPAGKQPRKVYDGGGRAPQAAAPAGGTARPVDDLEMQDAEFVATEANLRQLQQDLAEAAAGLSPAELQEFCEEYIVTQLGTLATRCKEDRRKIFKDMLVDWHPDKHPRHPQLAKQMFQLLQSKKASVL